MFYYNLLYELYRRGPFLNGFGFWCGKNDHEICAILTNVDSELWLRNKDECNNIIQRHYESFEVTTICILFTVCLYKLLSLIFTYMFVIKPIQKAIMAHNQNKLIE